jgi:hypothetical protein
MRNVNDEEIVKFVQLTKDMVCELCVCALQDIFYLTCQLLVVCAYLLDGVEVQML